MLQFWGVCLVLVNHFGVSCFMEHQQHETVQTFLILKFEVPKFWWVISFSCGTQIATASYRNCFGHIRSIRCRFICIKKCVLMQQETCLPFKCLHCAGAPSKSSLLIYGWLAIGLRGASFQNWLPFGGNALWKLPAPKSSYYVMLGAVQCWQASLNMRPGRYMTQSQL